MNLNLNDPDSIVAWWQVFPDRHDSYLAYKVKASPEFAPSINEALWRIEADPELSELRTQAEKRRGQFEAELSERPSRLSSLQLRHQELAIA